MNYQTPLNRQFTLLRDFGAVSMRVYGGPKSEKTKPKDS